MSSFKTFTHYLVAKPFIYDFVQFAVGVQKVQTHLARQIPVLEPNSVVIDIGGGTGIERNHFSAETSYICLDIDEQKIKGYSAKFGSQNAIQGDGRRLPLCDNSVDLAMMVFVTHHLTDNDLHALFAESVRVVKPSGMCLYVDPVWEPQRLFGRLLWRYDRGSYPRTFDVLNQMLHNHFRQITIDRFAVMHEYAIFACKV